MQSRILLLITDLQIGGTPTVVRELATRLHADPDFYVHVACLDSSGPVADQLRNRGVDVTPLNARGLLDLGVISRLIRLVHDDKIQTIFSFLVHANAVAACAAPFLPGVRFLQSIQTTQPNPHWHWSVQHFALRAAEKIVVPSPSVADAAIKWAHAEPGKIVVIPNAVDLSPEIPPRQNHVGKRVGFIGRLDPVKRVPDLIQAIPLLPSDVSLDIFGEGSQRGEIERVIRQLALGDRVKLHGAISAPDTALAEMDVLVLPSEAEGFGLVLIEAMAAGVPVVGTNVPGIRDVIADGEDGLLARPRDPASLAAAIGRILTGQAVRQRLVAAGRKKVEKRFDWAKVFDLYRELLGAPDGHPQP